MRTTPDALQERLVRHATDRRSDIALDDGHRRLPWDELISEIASRRRRLHAANARRVALALDNGIDWALWDLALLQDERVAVPVPSFFSAAQRRHLVAAAGLDTWIGPGGEAHGFQSSRDPAIASRRVVVPPTLHPGTRRITFTSGTSGAPKGVCLDATAPLTVATSIAEAVAPLAIERHLAMLPLSTLLENIGGLYVPLWLGGRVFLPGVETLGWRGASGFDPYRALATLDACRPHSLILVPQLLQALVETRPRAPESLRFVAVGGARVADSLLARARRGGWPVFEGYGLSECASVVSLNRTGEPAHGVGRPLPHAEVRIDDAGEVWVRGAIQLGYLGEPASASAWHATGDLGHWASGALVLGGRRREVFITAYGRNVNPQWVEGELCACPAIAQALVHGEALPINRALLVPASPAIDDATLAAAVAEANAGLPDYARVHEWRRSAPFTPHNQQLTANGRLRRDAILRAHGDWLCAAPTRHESHPSQTMQGVTP